MPPIPNPPKRGPKPRKPLRRSKALRVGQRSKRGKERAKLDKEFQLAGEQHWCDTGHYEEQTFFHHRIHRRHLSSRYDKENCFRLCLYHHAEIHRLGEAEFLRTYPMQELWENR